VSATADEQVSSHIDLAGTPRELADEFYRRGWSDGLPIIPPTDELVAEMVGALKRPGQQSLGAMPPARGLATIEALAVNAVLAGCHPVHFPIVVAAVEAMLEPAFNLTAIQATTFPGGPVFIVSGPARHTCGLRVGANAMGEGTQANATIGRAIRLILRNVGGARPGKTDFVEQGSPVRSGLVFAENEEESPFPPFHTALGFPRERSVITALSSEGPHNINDHSSKTARCMLEMVAGTLATLGSNDLARGGKPVVVLGPEHARQVASEGWTREAIQGFVFEHARIPRERMPKDLLAWFEQRQDIDRSLWDSRGAPLAARPEDIYVLVAGGAGKHSCILPSFGFYQPVSKPIDVSATPVAFKPVCDC
jgi:hypothetical protein